MFFFLFACVAADVDLLVLFLHLLVSGSIGWLVQVLFRIVAQEDEVLDRIRKRADDGRSLTEVDLVVHNTQVLVEIEEAHIRYVQSFDLLDFLGIFLLFAFFLAIFH